MSTLLSAPVPGDVAPSVSFVDLHGKAADTAAFEGWVVIYTFADRESSDRLMEWQAEANLVLARAYPELRIARVNFADVAVVPRVMRRVVEPILRRIDRRATARLEAQFKEAGLELSSDRARFFLVPDWNGAYLRFFGLENAQQYRCWVTVGGRVVGTCHEAPDAKEAFLEAFARMEQAGLVPKE